MRERLRVALFQSHLFYGSTEHYLQDLLERLDRDVFEPWLVCPDAAPLAPLRAAAAEAAVPVVEVPAAPPTPAELPWLVRTRRRVIRKVDPGIVHCADLDPPAMLASRLAGVGSIVVTYNTPELRPHYNAFGALVARAVWSLRPWTIFTSESDRATGLSRAPVDIRRTAVIPFGLHFERLVPAERSVARQKLQVADHVPVVGTVGLLREQKGHVYLLEAAQLLRRARPDLVVLIAGEGELRPRLEEEIRARGLERTVRLLGMRDDVPDVLAALDVFVLSSLFEGMCFAVAEALAVGVPVVATDVGGVSQSVVHGETGLLVRPRDGEGLADAVERMLADPSGAGKLAAAGSARVRRLYALPAMVQETQAVYARAGRST